MNFVESTTWATIQNYLNVRDPERSGWAIDVGIGDHDYYFEWLIRMGFRTIAIEPLPTDKAKRAISESNVPLIKAALFSKDGTASLHTARGIHSLVAELWGKAESESTVRTLTWNTLRAETGIERIALLKLDIEGAEGIVIQQITPDLLPAVLCFEFGGVWDQRSEQGPWSYERVTILLHTLAALEALGYGEAMMISSGATDKAELTSISSLRRGGWVDPDCNWGNIVTVLEKGDE